MQKPFAKTFYGCGLIVALAIASPVATGEIMEVDSTGVITQYVNGVAVGRVVSSAISFFNTLGPAIPSDYGTPPNSIIYADGTCCYGEPAGRIADYYFSVNGFMAYAGDDLFGNDPAIQSPYFSVGFQETADNIAFNDVSPSVFATSSDPWALFFNGATFDATDEIYGACYLGYCTSPGDPSLAPTYTTVSFSGVIHEVPEPEAVSLLGLGFATPIVRRRGAVARGNTK